MSKFENDNIEKKKLAHLYSESADDDPYFVNHLRHPLAITILSLLLREERQALKQIIIDDEENVTVFSEEQTAGDMLSILGYPKVAAPAVKTSLKEDKPDESKKSSKASGSKSETKSASKAESKTASKSASKSESKTGSKTVSKTRKTIKQLPIE